uniref:SFRICE_002456 n=1 Tax=Spodoptera frugiperda TaxID=7108 RepID=A0A2H1WBD1_SPOFR
MQLLHQSVRDTLVNEVPSKRKFQQAPDQYAVDEHGRRRFHGAFTGGFSAGFGNTVGSQEGWKPSNFKSSRSEKAAFSNQRPEDFMDEEDRGEFGIAPRQVQTQREFSGQKRQHRTQYHDGPIPGEPVLHQLLRPVHETAAVRMLRAMGWREGQGMGERLSSRDKKKSKEQHKVYGCYMPPELRQAQEDQTMEGSESSDSEVDFDTLFAPDDYEPYILQRKNDRFGLGYSGLSRHSVLGNLIGEYGSEPGSSKSHLLMKDKGKRVSIRGQAFGVGAFEADDEDIYAKEDMSHYDFSLDGPVQTKKNTPSKDSKKNRNVLEGFVKSTKPLPSVPTYPPPALPRDYVPAAAGARRSRFEPTTQQPRDQGLGRHELSARARGELLGETPLPPPPPETPVKDQKDPTTVLGKTINFISTVEKTELDYIPIKDSGKEITKVFKPFIGNPEKQKRYEKYLENKGVLERDGDMDKLQEWERERELVEFEQAAKLYKPLSGVMGDRFTHASEPDDAVNPLTAVAKSTNTYGLATKEQIEAAQKGMYGVMTRQTVSWRPDPLVSKRFNVPEIGGARQQEKKEDRPKVSYSIFSYLESSIHDKDSFAAEQNKFSGSKSLTTSILPKNDKKPTETPQSSTKVPQNNEPITQSTDTNAKPTTSASISKETVTGFAKRMTVAELFLKESENTKKEGAAVTDTIQKFDRMDLYKSIFLSDTEDEEESEKSKVNDGTDFIDVHKNVERNTSPPRGIFANIDFDEINSWRRKEPEKVVEEPTKKNESIHKFNKSVGNPPEEKNDEATEAMYGPKIPENLQKRLESDVQRDSLKETIDVDSSSSEDSWVDIKEVKNKKQKKKKSKKHKSKHKKKSKSKKKDR